MSSVSLRLPLLLLGGAILLQGQFSGEAYPFGEAFLLLLLLPALVLLALGEGIPRGRPPAFLLLALLFSALALAWSPDRGQGGRELTTAVLGAAAFLLAAGTAPAPRRETLWAGTAALLALLPAVRGAHQLLVEFPALRRELGNGTLPGGEEFLAYLEGGRAFAGFLNPNLMAGFLALLLPLLAVVALAGRGRGTRLLSLAGAVAAVAGLLFTRSLGGLLAALAGTAAALWAAGLLRRRTLLLLGGSAAGLLLLVLLLRGGAPLGGKESSLLQRWEYWKAGASLAARKPFLGWGTGALPETLMRAIPAGVRPATDPHQFLLRAWASGGGVALLLLLAFLGAVGGAVRRSFAARRQDPVWCGLLGGATAFLLHASVDMDLSLAEVALPAMALLGALWGMSSSPAEAPGLPRGEGGSPRPSSWAAVILCLFLLLPAGVIFSGEWNGFVGARLRQAGDPAAAVSYSDAGRILPWAGRWPLAEGRIRGERGELEGARLLFDRAGRLLPESPYPPWELGRLALRQGDAAAALPLLDLARGRFPSSPRLALERGVALERLGRRAEAAAAVREALSLSRFDPEAARAARETLERLAGEGRR